MSIRQQPESGLFTGRAEFYREAVTGEYDADPAYVFFSDNPRNVTYSPGLNIERRDGLGTPDAVNHNIGNLEPEVEVVYDLQQNLVDGAGDPVDPSADAWLRNADGRVHNTHHIRIEEDRESTDPDDPAGASGAKMFVIAEGAHPNVSMELDPENGNPVETTLTYSCEKVREYEVFQPDDSGIVVVSSDTDDNTQTLTLEDESGTSEEVLLDGQNLVATTEENWTSLRALELDGETEGDVTIAVNDGTTAEPTQGDTLATIRGSLYYSQDDTPLEGDLGVPAIGSGSFATEVGTAFTYFNGASVTRGGSALNYDLNRITASCENNWESTPRHDSTRMRWNEGNRSISLESDVVGWGASANFHDEALGINGEDIVVTLGSDQLTFETSVPVEPGDTERGPDDSAIEFSVTFEPSDDNGIAIAQV